MTLGGGFIAWQCSKVKYISIAETVAILFLFTSCYILLILGWWIPLIPPILVLFGTGGWVIFWVKIQR